MSKIDREYDLLVYIGRFQPFHNGHFKVVTKALELSSEVLILVGSANVAQNVRNPFTALERAAIITDAVSKLDYYTNAHRVYVDFIDDHTYNEQLWIAGVQDAVSKKADGNKLKIGLIGCNKDHSSYYLKMFPQWDSVPVEPEMNGTKVLSSTDLRSILFDPNAMHGINDLKQYVPSLSYLSIWQTNNAKLIDSLRAEQGFINAYKRQWEAAPYPPTFVTVDAVVVQSGHVLMIKRKHNPGKGLWALPGGFIGQDERLEHAAIRELKEETKIKVPVPVLKGSIVASKVFDDPFRSLRGRTITHAFYFKLDDSTELPKVKGSDDAEDAKWISLADIDPREIYEDHFQILRSMIETGK